VLYLGYFTRDLFVLLLFLLLLLLYVETILSNCTNFYFIIIVFVILFSLRNVLCLLAVKVERVEVTNKIFVGGVPTSMSKETLEEFFSKFGEVWDCVYVCVCEGGC